MSVHHCDNLRGSGTGAELALHFVQIAGRRAFYTLSYLPSARAIWVIARVSLLLYRVINRDSLPHAIGRYFSHGALAGFMRVCRLAASLECTSRGGGGPVPTAGPGVL